MNGVAVEGSKALGVQDLNRLPFADTAETGNDGGLGDDGR